MNKSVIQKEKKYNNFPTKQLGWLNPNELIKRNKSREESLIAI